MAWERFIEAPSLLREGHVLRFSARWAKEWGDKYFKVSIAQQMEFERHWILTPSQTYDISFDAPAGGSVAANRLSLLPESSKTVYEILLGLKGLPVVFPRYNDSYFLKLETTGVLPDATDVNLRFLGFYAQHHSPYEKPLLREHAVKDQTPPNLRGFNNTSLDERLVLRFIINRCKVEEVRERDLSEQERRLARKIHHFEDYIW